MKRFFLLCLFFWNNWQAPIHAQEWSVWKNAPTADIARYDAAGARVAFLGHEKLFVYRVGPNATLGTQIYASQPGERVLSFAWWGNGILVSRFKGARGETVRVLPGDAKTPDKQVLPFAGNAVLASPQGNRIAITPALVRGMSDDLQPGGSANYERPETRIEFYERSGTTWKKSGVYSRKGRGAMDMPYDDRSGGLYLVDWAFDGSGVFAVVPYDLSRSNDRVLALVTPSGRNFDLTSQNAPLIPERRYGLPLISSLKRGPWPTFGFSVVPISSVGPLSFPNASARQMLPPAWKYFTLIAWLPDGQRHLYQKTEEDETEDKAAPLCIVDAELKTRQLLPKAPLIAGAFGWNGDRLLVRAKVPVAHSNNSAAGGSAVETVWGTLRITPDTQRSEKVVIAPNEGRIAARPVLEFLKRPDIAAPAEPAPHVESPDENGFRTFRLHRWGFDSVKIEIATGRVVSYRGPAPRAPMPAAPIAIEAAQTKAQAFVRDFNTKFLEGETPVITVGTLDELMLYPVLFARAPNDWIEVGVRAADGKIGGYRESPALSDNEKRRLERPEPVYRNSPVSDPVFSPDGAQIAFCATRPTAGYPQWWINRPSALFVVGSRGGAPKRIAVEVSGRVRWSPDSKRVAFTRGGEILVADVQAGKTTTVPTPPSGLLDVFLIGWRNKDEVLIGWMHNGPGSTDLLSWKPAASTTVPQILERNWTDRFGNEDCLRGTALSPDGATLAIFFEQGFRSPTTLVTLPVKNLSATPTKVVSDVKYGYYPVWTRAGIFSFSNDGTWQTEPLTGKSSEWKAPAALDAIRGQSTVNAPTTGFGISPDGKTLAFPAFVDPAKHTGYTLFVADADGGHPRALFPAATP